MRTSELQGPALDWAVAKCEGYSGEQALDIMACDSHAFNFSSNWAQGGPIIERERVGFKFVGNFGFVAWKSYGIGQHQNEHSQYGPTPLIAAMRCYVASKLGDEIELPEEMK